MRILWHSNAPWCATGYGKQTAYWAPALASLGHQVAISAFHGLHGGPIDWRGIPVYPGGRENWGMDILTGHARHWQADLVITLMDTWVITPGFVEDAGLRLASWTPVDCEPMSAADRHALEATGATPIAMSRHGEQMMRDAGLVPLYVPHGIDTTVYAPPVDREGLRKVMGVDGRFVVGINAANTDHTRKGFAEQFQAFARFHRKHRDSLLLVHAVAENEQWNGLNLRELADACGISHAVQFADQYAILTGLVADEAMAAWYGALDLYSGCAWGEGFGLPIVEAQACGTPVVVTRAASMPELAGAGWMVDGQRSWISLHGAWWTRPDVGQITRAYEKAYQENGRRRASARAFASGYDVKTVLEQHWVPALGELAST